MLAQSLHSIELLAVNDGSTDESGDILARYADDDPRVKVLAQPNTGLAAARNRGVAAATSEFVAFVDSDDYIHPDMFDLMLKQISEEDSDIAICQFEQVDENGQRLKVSDLPSGLSSREWFCRILSAEDSSMACNKLFRRSLFQESGVRFPVGLLHEDVPAIVQLVYHARSISVVEQPLYSWVRRSGTITSRVSTKHVLDLMAGYRLVQEFLLREGILATYRREFVRRVAHFSVGLVDVKRTGLDEKTSDHLRALLCAWFDVLELTPADFELLAEKDPGLLRRVRRMLPVDREVLEKVRRRNAYLETRLEEIESSNGYWLWIRLARLVSRSFPAGSRRRAVLTRLTTRRSH